MRLVCDPATQNPAIPRLDLVWDAAAGALHGAGADWVLARLADGVVPLHPYPDMHVLSAAPLRSRADMAAVLGWQHRLPAELAGDYPARDEPAPVAEYLDESGAVVGTGTVTC